MQARGRLQSECGRTPVLRGMMLGHRNLGALVVGKRPEVPVDLPVRRLEAEGRPERVMLEAEKQRVERQLQAALRS